MRYLIGVIAISIVLFISTYCLLLIWGINMVSEENFRKTLLSLGIIIMTSIILVAIIYVPFFLKSSTNGYDKNQSGVAQKKL